MATPPAAGRRLRDIITPWRLTVTVGLAVAAVLMVGGFQATRTTDRTACSADPVVAFVPCPHDTDLRQGVIGAELASGYSAALQVDGTEIPQDQLRTGGANQVFFQPGAGTETGALAPGTHAATVIFWPTSGSRDHDAKSYTWQFSVT